MRGKPRSISGNRHTDRITPADAGKTIILRVGFLNVWDHPRGCGENAGMYTTRTALGGSPPRMRGKPHRQQFFSFLLRITPADAGKTNPNPRGRSVGEDHPRGCGENSPEVKAEVRKIGSPPRMRGKRRGSRTPAFDSGITPADAGKTLKRSFRNQPFCSRAVQISFNFSNSLNVSLQSGSAR